MLTQLQLENTTLCDADRLTENEGMKRSSYNSNIFDYPYVPLPELHQAILADEDTTFKQNSDDKTQLPRFDNSTRRSNSLPASNRPSEIEIDGNNNILFLVIIILYCLLISKIMKIGKCRHIMSENNAISSKEYSGSIRFFIAVKLTQ